MRQRTGGWSTAIIGAILLLAGLVWGLVGSHQIAYENSQAGVNYDPKYGETSGNLYFYDPGSAEYFIAYSADFTPAFSQSTFDNANHYTFVARTDTKDPNITLSGTAIDSAHTIEKLTAYSRDGSVLGTYTTAEYNANPNGIYVSVWSNALWLVGIGLLLAVGGVLQVARAPKTNFSIGGAMVPPYQPVPPAYPPVPPGAYPPADPYAQAYQGPGQYPPANSYAQPSNTPNPYQQPPQG